MKTFRCVGRYRENGKIIGYEIKDEFGNTRTVKANMLKNAIRNQEALVLNLLLTSDGRLIPKVESDNTKNNAKIVSLTYVRGNALLKELLKALDISKLPIRIIETGVDITSRGLEAYFYIRHLGTTECYQYTLIADRNGNYYIVVPNMKNYENGKYADEVELKVDSLANAVGIIASELRVIYKKSGGEFSKLPDNWADAYYTSKKTYNDFNINTYRNLECLIAGNNVVLMNIDTSDGYEPKKIVIPDTINVINNNMLDQLNGPVTVVCSTTIYRTIADIKKTYKNRYKNIIVQRSVRG